MAEPGVRRNVQGVVLGQGLVVAQPAGMPQLVVQDDQGVAGPAGDDLDVGAGNLSDAGSPGLGGCGHGLANPLGAATPLAVATSRYREVTRWSGRWDSNPRLFAWEANTLPLSYARSMGGRLVPAAKRKFATGRRAGQGAGLRRQALCRRPLDVPMLHIINRRSVIVLGIGSHLETRQGSMPLSLEPIVDRKQVPYS